VATITIDRPEKRNALNAQVRRELVAALDALETDDDVRVVVLTGAGDRAFVAGADIGEFAERTPIQQRAAMDRPPRLRCGGRASPNRPSPPSTAIALGGGCELALACDLRIAARSARSASPRSTWGSCRVAAGHSGCPASSGWAAPCA
jgi:enoyl-CoA hydratase